MIVAWLETPFASADLGFPGIVFNEKEAQDKCSPIAVLNFLRFSNTR